MMEGDYTPFSGDSRLGVGKCRGQRALVVRVSGITLPTVAWPVKNELMADGRPAKYQFVHFKELLFFQSEETLNPRLWTLSQFQVVKLLMLQSFLKFAWRK